MLDDGSLVIDRVVSDDAGEYVCEAQSPAGSAFAKTKLDVRGKKKWNLDSRYFITSLIQKYGPVARLAIENYSL